MVSEPKRNQQLPENRQQQQAAARRQSRLARLASGRQLTRTDKKVAEVYTKEHPNVNHYMRPLRGDGRSQAEHIPPKSRYDGNGR